MRQGVFGKVKVNGKGSWERKGLAVSGQEVLECEAVAGVSRCA